MKPSQSIAIMAALKASYPRATISDKTVQVYARMMEDLDAEAVAAAVREWVASSPHFPTVAELRLTVAEAACPLPPADEAWHEVSEAMLRWDDSDSSTWWPDWSSPELARCVGDVGGLPGLTHSRNISADRAQLLRLYEAARGRAIRSANLARLGLDAGARLELGDGGA